MNNADLQYRPLIGGISLLNARIGEPGTLGYFGRDALGATWLISAYHVLCNANMSTYTADESIYQPAAKFDPYEIAITRAATTEGGKSNKELQARFSRIASLGVNIERTPMA